MRIIKLVAAAFVSSVLAVGLAAAPAAAAGGSECKTYTDRGWVLAFCVGASASGNVNGAGYASEYPANCSTYKLYIVKQGSGTVVASSRALACGAQLDAPVVAGQSGALYHAEIKAWDADGQRILRITTANVVA